MKRYASMFAAYVVVTFIIAIAWHLVLFKEVYDQLGIFTRKEPIIPLGLASMAMQGAVLAYIYPLFDRGRGVLKNGLHFGLLMGVLMASIAVFAEAGKQHVASLSTWLTLESTYYLLQYSVVGVVLAFIHRRSANSQERENR